MNTTDILGEEKFPLGHVFVTPGADELIEGGLLIDIYLDRHWRGDWGDVSPEDKQTNEDAVLQGGRILSSFNSPAGRFWIITEADRSSTTVLTPDEY
jgi:hypothetical protein